MRKPPFWATLITFICLLILCTLGAWQIKRLHWKQAILARLDQAYADPHPPHLTYHDINSLDASTDFIAGTLTGHFTGDKQLLLGIRTWQGQMGYHLLAPFAMGGGAVLVNRGWWPLSEKTTPPLPKGTVTLTGILHRPERDNPFVPRNDVAAGRWYRWDLKQMAANLNIPTLAPLVLYEETEGKPAESRDIQAAPQSGFQPDAITPGLPVRAALHWELPNSHRSYAMFWFSLAIVLAGIYFLRFIR